MFNRFWWILPVMLIIGLIFGTMAAGGISYVMPRQYESTAVLQIRPQLQLGGNSTRLSRTAKDDETPIWMKTNVELIISHRILNRVIDKLDLINHWGTDRGTALRELGKMIEAMNIRGTDLIEIRVRSSNPADARMIASAVSEAFSAQLKHDHQKARELNIERLREAVHKQEEIVDKKRRVLKQLILEEGITYEDSSKNEDYSTGDEARIAAKEYADLESQKIRLESQIDTLLRYDGDQLLTYAAGLILPENIIRTLHPQYLEAKRQLAALKQGGLGDDHPSVVQQTSQVEVLRKDLEKSILALRETLHAQLELVKKQSARLETRKDELQERSASNGIDRAKFEDAKVGFESDQSVLKELKIKLVTEEMQRRFSEEGPVIIHSEPIEAMAPVTPNVKLNLVLGAVLGSVGGFILGLLLMPILHFMKSRG